MFQSFYPKPLDQFEIKCHRIVICVDCIIIHWNLSKANLPGTNFCVQNRQVFRLFGPRFPTFWLYLRRFLQDYILFRVLFKKSFTVCDFQTTWKFNMAAKSNYAIWLVEISLPSKCMEFILDRHVSSWYGPLLTQSLLTLLVLFIPVET